MVLPSETCIGKDFGRAMTSKEFLVEINFRQGVSRLNSRALSKYFVPNYLTVNPSPVPSVRSVVLTRVPYVIGLAEVMIFSRRNEVPG
jgi:hypothetical protein